MLRAAVKQPQHRCAGRQCAGAKQGSPGVDAADGHRVAEPLQELHVAVSTVSDAGLRPLSRLSKLQVLDASMCFKLTPK